MQSYKEFIATALRLTKERNGTEMPQIDNLIKKHQYCDRCWSMTATLEGLKALASKKGHDLHNRQDLMAGASAGCPLCRMIVDALNTNQKSLESWMINIDKKIRLRADFWANIQTPDTDALTTGHPFKGCCIFRFTLYIPGGDGRRMDVYAVEEDSYASLVHKRLPTKVIGREAVFQGLRTFQMQCDKEHRNCPKNHLALLPKRVLDVRNSDVNFSTRLYVTEDAQRGQYAALSYCWGGQQQFTTTVETLHANTEGMPISQLPQTIVDAIAVAQSLKIPFLWIDSLCIVQDSEGDKLEEISRMGEIYKNASVTIVAANAVRVTDGFLSKRPFFDPCPLPLYLNEDSYGTIYLSKQWDKYKFDDPRSDPLFGRGWAFQEFLLSPRVIIFDKYQVMWHCDTAQFKGFYDDIIEYSYSNKDRFSSILQKRTGDYYYGDQEKVWRKMVEEYSARDLSYFEDRLPALAGIAKELNEIWTDEYLAGLWRACLVAHLGWNRVANPGPKNPFKPFQHLSSARIGYPSWSWKTAPFAVHIDPVTIPAVEVIGCQVKLVSSDLPLGDVSEGILTLRAKMLPFEEKKDNGLAVILDYESVEIDNTIWQLLLGQEASGRTIVLIIQELGDKTFERIGWTFGSNLDWKLATEQIVVIK